ncbi:nitrate ABC transporter substrate-binding protein [Anaerocolumna cellulosilytica]|uniref:Nitrate ABC transporter substrate-binding protein n=1 Tax=Anaerocolumna cellulosilytica TaxID=433286 RepID=A0A6S6QUP9_9FIRM|nr:ABC transporter substrate-binding protein [Anaerocolumna cellulosilytica]MBB5194481.1 ABC-type nitrate/sulfonate/bicarbonate transport system substrate-binding protein [Anaerocolumna cellulosilytica]BCJ93426.1 nitrate ABC transporter substrate-binding protein [Anaerocolumna cellulosilytica]
MRKKLALVLSLLLVVTAFAACSKNKTNQETGKTDSVTSPENTDTSDTKKEENDKPEKVRIVLDWTPNTNHTGLYVAQSMGYFEAAGLEVEIMQPPEGSTTSLIGAGGAEFGISFQDTLAPAFASANPMPVTAVAAVIQHNTSGIISMKEAGIDTPAKLAGHSYATWDSPIELAIIKKIVEDDGGKFEDIQMIPNTVSDVVTALQTDIESVWVYYAWDGIATKVAGLNTNYLNFADYGTELDYYSPVIIANNDFLKEKPELIEKFLDAVRQGYEFSIENPEEAAEILVAAVPELDLTLVTESQKWLAGQYKAEVEQWGYIDPARWDAFYSWLYQNKIIEQEIPSGIGFSNDFLSK